MIENNEYNISLTRRDLLKAVSLLPLTNVIGNQESENSPSGIFQTGQNEIKIRDKLYQVQINPETIRQLIIYQAFSRSDYSIQEKVIDFLHKNPLEIHLSPEEAIEGMFGGRFLAPYQNQTGNWSTVELSQISITNVLHIKQATTTNDFSDENARYIGTLPHEIEHFINYIHNPDIDRLSKIRTLKIRSISVVGILAGIIAGEITNSLFKLNGIKTFLLPTLEGYAFGIKALEFAESAVEPMTYPGPHADTPEVYNSLEQRLKDDSLLRHLTLNSFEFTQITEEE